MAVKLKGRRSLVRSLAFLARGLNIEQAALELRRRYHPEANVAEVRKAYFPTRPIPIAQQQGKTREKIVQTLEKLKANAQRASEKMRRLHADPTFAKANAERMRRLHADPTFAKAHAERMRKLNADPTFAQANAERMRKLNADPTFAKAHAERMRRLHADPTFAQANAERMRRLHADPTFAKAHAERMRRLHADPTFAQANAERMRRLHADPAFRQKLLEGLNRFWNAYRAKKQGALEQMGFGKAGFDYTGRVAVTVVTPEELAAANEQHLAITSAVSSLPSLWQAVVASEFQLDHPVSSNYARKAADLNPEKRSKILQNAINALRKTRELKKIKPQNS